MPFRSPQSPRPESNPALTRNPGRDRPSAISRGQGRVAIQKVVRLVKAELRDCEFNFGQDYYRGTFRLRSPFEWLFGDWLVLVYQEAHFPDGESLKDLVSKNGPYLRF